MPFMLSFKCFGENIFAFILASFLSHASIVEKTIVHQRTIVLPSIIKATRRDCIQKSIKFSFTTIA